MGDDWTVRLNKVLDAVAGEWCRCHHCGVELPQGTPTPVLRNPNQRDIFDEFLRFCSNECREVWKAAELLKSYGGEHTEE